MSRFRVAVLVFPAALWPALLCTLVCSGVCSSALASAPGERGLPLMTVYRSEQHKGGAQTFAVAQDTRGTLYFGNLHGLLSHDGAWWSLLKMPNDSAVFSLAADTHGRVAVGAIDELGLVSTDAEGRLAYRSLRPLLPKELRDVGDVRSVCAHGDGFLYASEELLIFSDGKSARVIEDYRQAPAPRTCSVVGGKTYIAGPNGLRELGRPALFDGRKVDALLANGAAYLHDEGLVFLDGTPFAPDASAWLRGKTVAGGATLTDGRLAIATRDHGVLIIGADGAVHQIIDAVAGLPASAIRGLLGDREGALWLGLNSAIARVDFASPLTVIDERMGLLGTVLAITRHQGQLHFGTTNGVFRLDASARHATEPGPRVQRVQENAGNTWAFLHDGDDLYAGTSRGIVKVNAPSAGITVPGTAELTVYAMLVQQREPSRMWIAARTGLGIAQRTADGWRFERFVDGVDGYVRTLMEHDGYLWCGTTFKGIVRVGPGNSVTHFGSGEMKPAMIGGQLVFVKEGAIYRIAGERLISDPRFRHMKIPTFVRVEEDSEGNVFFGSTPMVLVRRRANGTYEREPRPILGTSGVHVQRIEISDGILWIGTERGMLRFEHDSLDAGLPQRAPQIHRIAAKEDQLLALDRASVPFDFQRLRIEFSPLSTRAGIAYQFRLDPLDSNWSRWSEQPFIDYTNLDAGEYTFRLRSRSAEGDVSDEARWSLRVMPPLYREPWAIAIWLLVAVAIVGLVVRARTRTLRRQAEKLRARVDSQTKALTHTVQQLREAQDTLVDQNALLEVTNIRLEQANAKLEKLAVVDELTGVSNRRYFERALADEWERAARVSQPLALVLLDLDRFKELNDTRGHSAGDECLRSVGTLLRDAIRGSGDVVARYGGEEFALLLPGTSGEDATDVAERMRQRIEREGCAGLVTASFGVAAVVPQPGVNQHTLVDRADRALYAAKHAGRNCVRVESGRAGGAWITV